ncbi:MAG: MucB/RseB C-terminal domain-containing protein [Wenzhouxiangella sp.]|nr:MucB/RseB C-terminal domain-containing protein [Wenzhouxiangella sp.]
MVRLTSQACLLVLASTWLLSTATPADNGSAEVRYWLDRMARAVETLNYRGTLVHWRDGQMDTLRIIHRADENGIRERIYSLDGSRREILRDGNQVRCLLAGDEPLVVQSQLAARLMPSIPLNRLGSPESSYRMRLGGRERVAGMKTRIVEIHPLDEFRYGYRFWLEKNTGMLLRSALLDHSGEKLQHLSFVTVELGVPISDAELEPDMEEVSLETTLQDELPAGRVLNPYRVSFMPARLPENFSLVKAGSGSTAEDGSFEHLIFSDGLASFSIYIERASGEPGPSGRVESIGPVHVYTGQRDGYLLTVVGEVPRATVEYVGRSIEPTRPEPVIR